MTLAGFLVFLDRPKANARASLDQLESLGISVKIATGDNAKVAEKVCAELGVLSGGTLTGAEVEAMSDGELAAAARQATIFARVSPEQKARIINLLRLSGGSVGFLGDGVNDALALHEADIGISVDTATDVAKDAADVVLMDKDLGVLAEGVMEGRRIFANTIKYVLMGTSSNFGNMFSAATASVVLSFLPMLPGQILLNNLLYDTGQLAIPGDRVDKEQLLAPSHWNIAFIRRFMFLFGPISSIFDFADVRPDAVRVQCRARRVPGRLVHRVHRHANAHHLRHPDQARPLPAQPAFHRAAGRVPWSGLLGCLPSIFSAGGCARVRPFARAILPSAFRHDRALSRPG